MGNDRSRGDRLKKRILVLFVATVGRSIRVCCGEVCSKEAATEDTSAARVAAVAVVSTRPPTESGIP